MLLAILTGGNSDGFFKFFIKVAETVVAQESCNIQYSHVGVKQKSFGRVDFYFCQVGNNRFSGILLKIVDDNRRGITGQSVNIRSPAGQVLRRVNPLKELSHPFRGGVGERKPLLVQKDDGMDDHFENQHGDKFRLFSGFQQTVQLPGIIFKKGKVIVGELKGTGGIDQQFFCGDSDALTELFQFVAANRQVNVDAALRSNGSKLMAVLRANQTDGFGGKFLPAAIQGMVGLAGCDDKNFIVIMIMQRSIAGIPPMKRSTAGTEIGIIFIIYGSRSSIVFFFGKVHKKSHLQVLSIEKLYHGVKEKCNGFGGF